MKNYILKLPDLGEGVVESEIVTLYVKEGEIVEEDQLLLDIMTDKATVEVTSPVQGRVVSLAGSVGDMIAVGTALVVFEISDDWDSFSTIEDVYSASSTEDAEVDASGSQGKSVTESDDEASDAPPKEKKPSRVQASPSLRKKAAEHNVDLSDVPVSDPSGRLGAKDLDAYIEARQDKSNRKSDGRKDYKLKGLRKVIAQKMQVSKRSIPHYSYIEEVDVTELDALREQLNSEKSDDQPKLTYLPFVMCSLVQALREYPQCNANFNDETNIVTLFDNVHIGVGTQTPDGLKVPVVRYADSRKLWDMAAELKRVSSAAKDNTAERNDLMGSTITVTSLGRYGGLVTTPVINHPEVAIIGVNKLMEKPVVIDGNIVVRKMMNLSASFDHRLIDGWDAANMIQFIKRMLEDPSQIEQS